MLHRLTDHVPGDRWRHGFALAIVAATLLVIGVQATAAVRTKVENPHGSFKEECALCHTAKGWKPAKVSPKFDHGKLYGFPLSGAHATDDCLSCHTSLEFTQAKTQCASCHSDAHRGEMGADCARCHSARSFTDRSLVLERHQQSRFPLTGSHAALDCEGCHRPGAQGKLQFVNTKAECKSCHMPEYQAVRQPDHVAGGYPQECQQCHTTLTWSTAKFDHDQSGFPLTGAHRTTACAQCHGDGVFRGKTKDCYGCHQSDFTGATQPNHVQSQLPPQQCATCHTTRAFQPASYNHDLTDFPLTGAHRAAACIDCHRDGVYNGKPTDCYSCHQADYTASRTPNHVQAQFPQQCAMCHTTTAFQPSSYNHDLTNFPLTGAHRTTVCSDCHGDGVYRGKSTDCYSCHQADYTGTRTPNHVQAQLPQQCAVCHSTTAFQPANYNHDITNFPLTGAHRATTCNDCHGDGVYRGKPTDCYSCHQADFTGAQAPNHVQAQFPQQCLMCHTTTAFQPSSYNHDLTNFPLTGAHRATACNDCHGDGVYRGKSTDCYSCHQADYTGTRTPNHVQAQFPQQCAVCHTTTAFQPASYNHDLTRFPLTGAHRAAACNDCHGDGVYRGKSTACESCHTPDYNTTTNPSHTAAHFPMQCATCHSTTAWQPSTWDHDTRYFPIYSGAHRGRWNACSDCHTNSQNYQVFTCLSCHPHSDKTKTDGDHRGERNYSYTSSACYSCHPRGRS